MKNFNEWLESKEYMAKGVNIQSNLPLSRHIVGLSVVDQLNANQIASDPQVAREGGMPHPNSIMRLLKKFGLTKEVKAQMKSSRQSHGQKSEEDYDKYHNRNTFGTNPDRVYMPQTIQDAMENPLPPEHDAIRSMVLPKGYIKVLTPEGVYVKPQDYTLKPGEKIFKPQQEFYSKAPRNQKGIASFDDFMAKKQAQQPQAQQPQVDRTSREERIKERMKQLIRQKRKTGTG